MLVFLNYYYYLIIMFVVCYFQWRPQAACFVCCELSQQVFTTTYGSNKLLESNEFALLVFCLLSDQILSQRDITVPQFTDSSPDTPTTTKTLIGHPTSDPAHTELIGNRPDAEGSDSPFSHSVEYENWDLLRGVLRKKSGLKRHPYSSADIQFMIRLTKTQVCFIAML